MQQSELISRLLTNSRTIAVVGMSDNPARASYQVGHYMARQGYTVYPVNPSIQRSGELKAYAALADLPEVVDLVDVFRDPAALPDLIDEVIAYGAPALWLQLGVVHPQAIARAEAAGLQVVVDRCLKVDHALQAR